MGSSNNTELITALENFGVAAGQAIREVLKKMSEESKTLIKSWNDLYYRLAEALGDREAKKRLRQQSIRDKRQQLERSRRRQQLLAANKDKPNNWRRLHGLPAKRKIKKRCKIFKNCAGKSKKND